MTPQNRTDSVNLNAYRRPIASLNNTHRERLDFQRHVRLDPTQSALRTGGGNAAGSAGFWHTNARRNDLRWPRKTRPGGEVSPFLMETL